MGIRRRSTSAGPAAFDFWKSAWTVTLTFIKTHSLPTSLVQPSPRDSDIHLPASFLARVQSIPQAPTHTPKPQRPPPPQPQPSSPHSPLLPPQPCPSPPPSGPQSSSPHPAPQTAPSTPPGTCQSADRGSAGPGSPLRGAAYSRSLTNPSHLSQIRSRTMEGSAAWCPCRGRAG